MASEKLIYADSAAVAVEYVEKHIIVGDSDFLRGYMAGIKGMEEQLSALPAVDAVEVVHGRWGTEKCNHKPHRIKNPEKWVIYKCSVCCYSNGRKQSNYCPNCGAKMDGEGKDNELPL